MIIQGANEPIRFQWDDINDIPTGSLSISLRTEIEELKHWGLSDCTVEDDGMTIIAPITQQESKSWELGPCIIEAKWLDDYGNTMFMRRRDTIIPWGDSRTI